jgi:hypothetical protein
VTRVLTILATVAVATAPVASAGSSKVPLPGVARQAAVLYNGHAGLGANTKTDGDVAKGIVTNNKDPDKLGAARARGSGVIASVNVKYT